jgi:hypothetical protein
MDRGACRRLGLDVMSAVVKLSDLWLRTAPEAVQVALSIPASLTTGTVEGGERRFRRVPLAPLPNLA